MRVPADFDHKDTRVVVTLEIVVQDEVLLHLQSELKLQDLPQAKKMP